MSSQLRTGETHIGAEPARSLLHNILRRSSLYSIASIGAPLASLILIPVTTRFIAPADYGVLDLLEKFTIIVSLLIGLNFSSALGFFYFGKTTREERGTVVGTLLIGSLLIGGVAGGVGVLGASPFSWLAFATEIYAPYLRVMFLAVVVAFVLDAGLGWLRVEDRSVTFIKVVLLRLGVIIAGTLVGVALLRMGIWGVILANFGAIVLATIAVVVCWLRAYRPVFDLSLFIRMVRFSVPLGMSGIALFIIHFGDRFFLSHYRPLNDLGIYSLAYKIGMLLSLIHSSFHAYWSAQVYQIARREDAGVVMARVFSYMMLVLSFCGLGLIVASRPMLRVFTTPAYYGAAVLIPVIVLAYYVRAIGDFFRCLFLVEGRPGYDAACNWIGAGVCLGGYIGLIPLWGAWGAAIATLIAFLVIGVIAVTWTYRLKPYRIEGTRLLKIAIAVAAPLGVFFSIPVSSLAAQIGWGAILLLSYPILLTVLRFPTPGELDLLRSAPGRLHTLLGGEPG